MAGRCCDDDRHHTLARIDGPSATRGLCLLSDLVKGDHDWDNVSRNLAEIYKISLNCIRKRSDRTPDVARVDVQSRCPGLECETAGSQEEQRAQSG